MRRLLGLPPGLPPGRRQRGARGRGARAVEGARLRGQVPRSGRANPLDRGGVQQGGPRSGGVRSRAGLTKPVESHHGTMVSVLVASVGGTAGAGAGAACRRSSPEGGTGDWVLPRPERPVSRSGLKTMATLASRIAILSEDPGGDRIDRKWDTQMDNTTNGGRVKQLDRSGLISGGDMP